MVSLVQKRVGVLEMKPGKQDYVILATTLALCAALVVGNLPDASESHTDRPQARPTHLEAL